MSVANGYETVSEIRPIEGSLYDYIQYDEIWTLRHMCHDALQELERTIGVLANSGHSMAYFRNNYDAMVDLARKRFTSSTFNEGELIKYLQIRVFS